jgi:methylmalonyl-CoA/ethylmalonyl-CoA epimerase
VQKTIVTLAIIPVAVIALLCVAAAVESPAAAPDPGLKNLVQVCIVCRDVEATSKLWAAALGVPAPSFKVTRPGHDVHVVYRGKPSNGQAKIATIDLGQVTLELLQPVGPDTAWREFLDKNGDGVHHVAFRIADVNKTLARFDSLGMPVVHRGGLDGDNGEYMYIDSQKSLGVTLELIHRTAAQ